MNIQLVLAEWGINAIAMVAGTIGGYIILTLDNKEISFRNASCQIVSSMAFSGYGTEWLIKWFRLEPSPSATGFVGLCFGICGLYAAKGVIKWGQKFAKDPISFIKNKGGLNNDNSN